MGWTFRDFCIVTSKNNKNKGLKKEEEQPSSSLKWEQSRENELHLVRKHCNLYSRVAGDQLTFTGPLERRIKSREVEEGKVAGENPRFDSPTRQDGCL